MAFLNDNIDASLTNWCDLFLSAINDNIPRIVLRNSRGHPWIDKELLSLIKKKNKQTKKAHRTSDQDDWAKFKDFRRKSKQLMAKKKKKHANDLKDSLLHNPKRFWSLVKSISPHSAPVLTFYAMVSPIKQMPLTPTSTQCSQPVTLHLLILLIHILPLLHCY